MVSHDAFTIFCVGHRGRPRLVVMGFFRVLGQKGLIVMHLKNDFHGLGFHHQKALLLGGSAKGLVRDLGRGLVGRRYQCGHLEGFWIVCLARGLCLNLYSCNITSCDSVTIKLIRFMITGQAHDCCATLGKPFTL